MLGILGELIHPLGELIRPLSEIFRTIIIMSLSGSMLALILFALKPVFRHRLPKSVQYYLWLVVLIALLLPISRLIIMPSVSSNVALTPVYTAVERISGLIEAEANSNESSNSSEQATIQPIPPQTTQIRNLRTIITTILLAAYPAIVLMIFLINILSYIIFTGKIRRNRTRARMEELYEHVGLCGDAVPPRLYRSTLAATPMLIGILKPEVVLPDREYTGAELQSVLQHEIVHLRRRDVVIKWLSVIACALHWFNPIVWMVRREIDRTCELSCDEAVIRKLNTNEKQSYGDTLISVAAVTKTSRAVLSTTMCEEKEELKERLNSIMKYQQRTWITSLISTVIIVIAICSVTILGAGAVASPGEGRVPESLATEVNRDGSVDHEKPLTKDIDLSNSNITDETLAEMIASGAIPQNARTLTLSNNLISDLTPLLSLTGLEELRLESNLISDITPLASLQNLTMLDLTDNLISDITPLQSLTKLSYLSLSANRVSDITPLQSLTKLRALYLAFNQINDLAPLISIEGFDGLYLSHNEISDISPLLSLKWLRTMSISENRLSSSQIEELTSTFPALILTP